MHRPGPELQRAPSSLAGASLLRRQPWVSRARQEHDVLCQELRDHGVEVLYLTALLQDVLQYQPARDAAVAMAVGDARLGDELRHQLRAHLDDLGPGELAAVLITGLTPAELRAGHGVVYELLDRHDFVLDPLPDLLFSRDASFWIGDQVAVASPAAECRRREAGLSALVYRHHPRFAGTKWLYDDGLEHLDGGDVLLLSPGVVAIGVGQRTTPAAAERLTRRLFDGGLAHTVLAVPSRQHGGAPLDTLCAVVGSGSVLMQPAVAYALTARLIWPRGDGMRVSRPRPFLEAAAEAIGIGRLHVIDSGVGPLWGESASAGEGGNVLTIAPGVVVSHERNLEANVRLERAGVEVIRVPSSELSTARGGPRCMTCVITRDPAPEAPATADASPALGRATVSGALSRPLAGGEPADLLQPQPGGLGDPVPVGAVAVAGHADIARAARDVSQLTASRFADSRLEAVARSLPGSVAKPEQAERQASEQHHERDQRQPEECLDDRRGYKNHHDGPDDQQQYASHTSTVRRRPRRGPAGRADQLPSPGTASRRNRRPRLPRLRAIALANQPKTD